MENIDVKEIPIRLVQSAGDTFLSRITSMLNYFLNPISTRYCNTNIKEYCKDSGSYLKEPYRWKYHTPCGKECCIVAGDVKSLYPSLARKLVKTALEDALKISSFFSEKAERIMTKLTMYCLENILLEFQNNLYVQDKGVITGDNDSVAIANIALHFIIKQITEIPNNCIIFKLYIDDILFITAGQRGAEIVRNALRNKFKEYV